MRPPSSSLRKRRGGTTASNFLYLAMTHATCSQVHALKLVIEPQKEDKCQGSSRVLGEPSLSQVEIKKKKSMPCSNERATVYEYKVKSDLLIT